MSSYFDGSPENSGSAVVDGVDYKVITGPDNRKWKIFNFDNPNICPRSGVIEIVATKRSTRHENRYNFSVVKDEINDIWIGIPNGFDDKTKDMKFKRHSLREDETLNLSLFVDAQKWAIIKNCSVVEGSPNCKYKAKYRVYDKEREAQLYTLERKVKRKAETIADGLFGAELYETALNIGLPVENISDQVLSMQVSKFAETQPKRFMEVWDSPTRKEMTVFNRARAVGLVKHDLLHGFMYSHVPMGQTEAMVVTYLKDNPQVCQTIDMLTKEIEKKSSKSMSLESKPVSLEDEKDIVVERQRQEIEDLRKKYEDLAKKQGNELAERQSEEHLLKTDPEMLELLKEAKAIGLEMRGAHLMNKETLKKKIEEKISEKHN